MAACVGAPDDEREMLPVPLVGEDEHQIARVPRAMVVNIIRPRLEETFELVRDRLDAAGLAREAGTPRGADRRRAASWSACANSRRACWTARCASAGRMPVRGLPETASGPAFATPLGLLAWARRRGPPAARPRTRRRSRRRASFRRFVNWLRDRVVMRARNVGSLMA